MRHRGSSTWSVSGQQMTLIPTTFDVTLFWNLRVLGEASSQVSAELKESHPEVVWSNPIRLRNRLVHGYWSIETEVVVVAASDDLPPLLDQLRAIQDLLREV